MIIRVAAFALALLPSLAFAASASGLTAAEEKALAALIVDAQESDLAYDILESLTTEVGPRLAGSQAEARARDWGVAKLKSLGFKNVRVESFEIPYWSRTREEAAIVSPFPQNLAATALGNSVATPVAGIEAPIVRFPTLAALEAAPQEGLEGKIVFVDEPMTRTQDGSGYGAAVRKRSGAANAAGARGALAAIIRSVGTDERRFPHTGNMRYLKDVTPVPIVAVSNPDADQLARALERSSEPVVVSLNVQVETRKSVASGNVIGEIPGASDELIVIGGHLDSWDLGTGAVDDGAGVAITTAAAKLIDRMPGKPARTIRVVMWGAEETGLWGARAYAEAHRDELDKHYLASESDFGAGNVWQFQSRFAEDKLDKRDVFLNALRPLGISPGDNNASGGPDVGPLRALGVPAVTLRQNGWDYFDLHHTPDDTLDKIDEADLKQNVAAWAAMLYIATRMEGDFRTQAEAVAVSE